ncbi:jg24392, partial [Pararge aegeria aegeria]
KDPTTWSICDIPLPICGDDSPRASNPVPDSVAAGFVAQATSLAAAILNQPLRYKITLLGSASKILDITPDLPDPNIPLFARGGDITLFRYALFLLNKCIAQLLWGRGLSVHDMRPTLANLQRLLTTPSNLSDTSKLFGTYRWLEDSQCARTQSLRNLVPSERGKYRQFNRFKVCMIGLY